MVNFEKLLLQSHTLKLQEIRTRDYQDLTWECTFISENYRKYKYCKSKKYKRTKRAKSETEQTVSMK